MSNILISEELLQGIIQKNNAPKKSQDDPTESLADRIKDMIASGATLELIILAIMTNDSGNGAMDICSSDIAKITKGTDELILTLSRSVSSCEVSVSKFG